MAMITAAVALETQQLAEDLCTELWLPLFQSSHYLDWRAGKSKGILRIYAGPCCGKVSLLWRSAWIKPDQGCVRRKTTFAAAVTQALQVHGLVVSIVLHARCNLINHRSPHAPSGELPPSSLCNAILEQITGSIGSAPSATFPLDDARFHRKGQAEQITNKFLLLDGIDSFCTESKQTLDEEIAWLINQGWRVSIVTTEYSIPTTCDACLQPSLESFWRCRSCPREYDLCRACFANGKQRCKPNGHPMYEMFASVNMDLRLDLDAFIDVEITKALRSRRYNKQLHEQLTIGLVYVKEHIMDRAQGNFAICKALVDHLRDEQMDGYTEIITHIHDRICFPVAELFDIIFRRVKSQPEAQSSIAMSVLHTVSQASKTGNTITLTELTDLVSTSTQTDSIKRKSELVRVCQGMIMINSDATVDFTHSSARTFLNENCEDDFRAPEMDMGKLCLLWLSEVPTFPTWNDDNKQKLLAYCQYRPFAAYAARAWGAHLRSSPCYANLPGTRSRDTESATEYALKLLQNEQRLTSVVYLASVGSRHFDLLPGCHPLHVCAHFGLVELVPRIDNCWTHCYVDPVYERSALVLAAVGGHIGFVEMLLQSFPATVSNRDISKALLGVLKSGRDERRHILELLLGHAASTSHTFSVLDTTIIEAHSPLDHGCDGGKGSQTENAIVEATPLIHAITTAVHDATKSWEKLATHRGIDINERTESGMTALHYAVRRGYYPTIQLLLEQPSLEFGLADKTGKTALHNAALFGEPDTIKLFLSHLQCNADVLNIPDVHQRTAIMLVFENFTLDMDTDDATFLDVLDSFKNVGADFHCRTQKGRGLLHIAAERRKAFVMEYLLGQGLHVDDLDSGGWSPLHIACCIGDAETASKLLQLRASPSMLDARGWTPAEVAELYNQADLLDNVDGLGQQCPRRFLVNGKMPRWSFAFTAPSRLLEIGSELYANLDELDPFYGNTALQNSMVVTEDEEESNWNEQILIGLIHQGSIDCKNDRGMTGLEYAVLYGHESDPCYFKVLQELLDSGANPDKVSFAAETLIDAARRRQHWRSAVRLINRSKMPVRMRSDFEHLVEAAIKANDSIALENLMKPDVRALRKCQGRLPSAFAQEKGAADYVVQLLQDKEHEALQQLWSSGRL
jgi:ankyrin repeat protein